MKSEYKKPPLSETRRQYFFRLGMRIIILMGCILLWVFSPQSFSVLDGMAFFTRFSLLHVLWLIWVIDMFLQLVPVKSKLAIGSQKLFAYKYHPILEAINYSRLRDYVVSTTKAAYKVFIFWGALMAVIGELYFGGIVSKIGLFMISVTFYVCDLICVLIWCPFRLIMKNKCCTTCRIFNWDHIMMFLPLVFMGGFFSLSLVAMAFIVWAVWELCIIIHPERFCEMTNTALKCSECTDKLCTQYCQKLRR